LLRFVVVSGVIPQFQPIELGARQAARDPKVNIHNVSHDTSSADAEGPFTVTGVSFCATLAGNSRWHRENRKFPRNHHDGLSIEKVVPFAEPEKITRKVSHWINFYNDTPMLSLNC
jgi:hypothetical protein